MIDRILTFSVQHRWVVLLLTGLMMVIGGLALVRLPIDAVPDITNNQVQINTVAPSLSPVEVERQVTFPVENALAGIAGLRSTRSLSRNGFSQVTAVFDDDVDIYFARQQVLERLTAVRENMPRGAEPRMGAISTGLGEIYMWSVEFAPQGDPTRPTPRDGQPGWQSDGSYLTPEGESLRDDHRRAAYLRTLQDWVVRPQLRTVRGVAGVDSIGGYAKQYHVQPSTARLVALGLTFQDIVSALERNNASIGAGYFERGGEAYAVRADGRVGSLQEIEAIPVASREGVPILIRDVATVTAGRELRTGSASMNGEEVVIGTALMLIGENSRTVAASVGARIAEVNRAMPPGVRIRTVLDRTVLVDATIGTVSKNLAEGALLVVAVLFLLLGNIRAALVTAAVIPITMLLTAAGMLRGHISANLMSLGALDFGLIVDGAVIITENALRRLAERQHEEGRVLRLQERLETVAAAAKQMVKPSLYGQAIIILVYLPMLTFSGVEGKMFAPMALTVIIALVAAFVLSLTFVPAAIAIFVGGRVTEKENRAVLALKAGYRPALRAATAAPMPVILAAALLFGGSLALFARLGQEFIPTLDEKNLAVQALRVPSTSLTQSQAMQSVVERTISRFPEVAFVFSKTGTAEIATDPMPPNISDTFIMLRPQEAWPNPRMTKAELIAQIEAALARIPGNAYEFTQPIQMRFNELIAGVRGDIAIKIFGDDFGPMLEAAERMASALRATPGATDVRVEQATGLPFLDIRINRAAAARWGLSIADVQEAIAIAVGGREAGLVFEGDRRFDIIVRLPDVERSDLDALRNLPVPLPSGTRGVQMLPLRELATFRVTEGPNQVSRENGKRRIVVQANVRGRDIGSVVADAHARIERDVRLPPGYWTEWGGQFENLVAARQRLAVVVPACFALILLLLFSALRSWRDAAVVFTGVPLALTGGILALWIRDMPFSISAAVGFIALSGVAVLNGLVMVSYIRQLSTEGRPWREAIVEGALTRLRPVVMTALVAALGFVPMALATGTGAEVQRPLATVVIGGLISATVLTLVVLPALLLRFGKSPDETPAPPTPEVRIEPRLDAPRIAAPDLVAGS